MTTRRITLELDAELDQGLRQVARDRGRSEEDVVRDIVADAVRHHAPARQSYSNETALDRAKRLGIVGCVKDAPPDLSTDPKHMEGFGE